MEMSLALSYFEATEANLAKLERLWNAIEASIPAGGFMQVHDVTYENNIRAYRDILGALPLIDGYKPVDHPRELSDLVQDYVDCNEVGDIEANIAYTERANNPGKELREYRFRLDRKRKQLVRQSLVDEVAKVDRLLSELSSQYGPDASTRDDILDARWQTLSDRVGSIATLLGSDVPKNARWGDLHRHLRFGMVQDLRDIVEHDWPAVRKALSTALISDDEPLPVAVADLGDVVRQRPKGSAVAKLNWRNLDPESFERLVFSLLSSAAGYENALWGMKTNAPDRGRDLSVDRVLADSLGGSRRERVLVQCRHWLSRSISLGDVATLQNQLSLWEPPRVDCCIIATSGRFTQDVVSWIERNNAGIGNRRIEMWPESQLELLLAARPHLIAEFGLR